MEVAGSDRTPIVAGRFLAGADRRCEREKAARPALLQRPRAASYLGHIPAIYQTRGYCMDVRGIHLAPAAVEYTG